MAQASFDSGRLSELGIDEARAEELVARMRGFVDDGEIPSCQLAVARNGQVAIAATFGEVTAGGVRRPATNDTLYPGFSTTKAVTSSAAWVLLQEGKLALADRVVDRVPEFGANGKEEVRVEHLLTHTAGFPDASFLAEEWEDRDRRLARFASWTLEWKPGERFQYHGSSSM